MNTTARNKPRIFSGNRTRNTRMWKRVNTDITGDSRGTGVGVDNKMNSNRYHAHSGTVNTTSGWEESSGDSDDDSKCQCGR